MNVPMINSFSIVYLNARMIRATPSSESLWSDESKEYRPKCRLLRQYKLLTLLIRGNCVVLELSILVGEVVARIFGRAVTTLEVVTSDKKSFTMCSVVTLHRFFLSTGVLRISSLFFSFRLYGALQQSFYSGMLR